MNRKFSFHCGRFDRTNYIYAIKSENYPWHYFKECDSYSSQHNSLPAAVDSFVTNVGKLTTISLCLKEEVWKKYYENGQFVFKNEKLEKSI